MRAMSLALAAALALGATAAGAQRREHAEFGERYHSPHWVYDARYHHGHYYPALGYVVPALPVGNIVVGFRGGRFFFHAGVWFQAGPGGYVVVRPPVGIVLPVLPPAATAVWIGNIPYYYANETYYVQAPAGGYTVAEPPAVAGGAPAMQAPPAPAPAPQAAPQASSWYYCESTKAYYPYVNECREGWKQVPATPPR